MVAIVIERLKRLADAYWSTRVDSVVIGYPVTFETDDGGDTALERLRDAARLAGFDRVGFCPEPYAAASSEMEGYGGQTVCAVDFGGGTFDVAILTSMRAQPVLGS